MEKPAVLGGNPVSNELIPIIKPPLYNYATDSLISKIRNILESGMVTNDKQVQEFENKIKNYIGVKNTVCLSSCTSGLILTLKALGVQKKEVIIPSFTFLATGHTAHWNNCKIKFVDIDPKTFNISIEDLEDKITKDTAAVLPVHIYGNPCDVKQIEDICEEYDSKLVFDSAHGFGASYKGEKVGNFGDAEVFSCSPTKLLITLEGGIVTTNNTELYDNLKLSRNYGNTYDNDCDDPGLNARMTEINAAVGLELLGDIEKLVENRNNYARIYKKNLSKLPGITFQQVTKGANHAYKDFVIIVDKSEFGMDRNKLQASLNEENIMTKKYFHPPLHQIKAFKVNLSLPVSENISENVLALPMYSFMDEELIERICYAIKRIHEFSKEI